MSTSSRLRVVGPEPSSQHGSPVDLILIAGIGTPSIEEWAIVTDWWRKFLATTASSVRILTFDHSLVASDDIQLETFVAQGDLLLNCLSQHILEQEEPRPLLFICHSLGSFILKRALVEASDHSHRYTTLIHALLGIAFLGGPHGANDPDSLAEATLNILRSAPNSIAQKIGSPRLDELRRLAELSKQFQATMLRVEIQSLHERNTTSLRIGIREGSRRLTINVNRTKEVLLVDESLAETGVGKEDCYGMIGSHGELCKLLDEHQREPSKRFREWLKFVLGEAFRNDIEHNLRSVRLPESPHLTATSFDPHEIAIAKMSLSNDTPSTETRSSDVLTPPDSGTGTGTGSGAGTGTGEAVVGSDDSMHCEVVPINHMARYTAQLPCFMIDTLERNTEFLGQTEVLSRLDEGLLPPETSSTETRHVFLYGMGGLGKTSIALEFAFSRQDKFDAIFWLRADEPMKLQQDFSQIASRLGLEDPTEAKDPHVSLALAMGWLTNPRRVLQAESDDPKEADATWLLIFDNADDPNVLKDYWPPSSSSSAGSILVTSRHPYSKAIPTHALNFVELEPLSSDEGATLLQKLTTSDQSQRTEAILVAQKLGGLPLAICQMAAVISENFLTYEEFLEDYDNQTDRREHYNADHQLPGARGNLASIFAIEQLGPSAKALLEVLMLLDPDSIEERILQGDVARAGHSAEFSQNRREYIKARADLVKRSLIKHNHNAKTLWVHRILQDSVRIETPDNRLQTVFKAAVDLLSGTWGRTSLDQRHVTEVRKSREGLYPHALRLKQFYEEENSVGLPVHAEFVSLMCEAGWWQHERGNSHDSKAFFELGLKICQESSSLEELQQLYADIRYGLAAATNETNDAKGCLEHTQVLLDLRLQISESSGVQDIRLAVAHNELGIAYIMNSQYDSGIEAFNKSIRVYAQLPEFELAMDTNPRTNLAFTYWVRGKSLKLLGKFEDSADMFDKAATMFVALIRDREIRFGVDDTESYRTGRVWHGLGNVRFDQGYFQESEALHKKSLAHYQHIIGNTNHKTADLMYRVAHHCLRRQDYSVARTWIDEALKVWQMKETVFTPELARAHFLKAKVALQSEDEIEATALFRQAIILRNRIKNAPRVEDSQLRESDFDELLTFYDR